MTFSSLIFIFVFLPLFILSYFVFKNRMYRNLIILVFSLAFYAWGEPIYILLMLFSITINYLLALFIDKSAKTKRKVFLILAVIINLGLLGIFKYTDFIINNINLIFNTNISNANIPLPIGISFYTFQALSYVIDVYLKKVKVQKNIFYLGCYITFFPQLIAGPIVRYETIEHELSNRKENISDFAYGIRRFIKGLGKKVLIADNVGYIATALLSLEAYNYGFLGALIGIVAYALQIYFDFSGYSDMAIGLGRMFGFKFLENFNYPYIATSITDFWRRWHISLSSFFRDYVYIPLGGNRVKKGRFIFNVIVVWTLTGLWHGANINFMLWGMYYGILLLIEKLFLHKYLEKLPKVLRHLYAIIIILIGWGIFRATSFNDVKDLLQSLIFINGLGNFNMFTYTGAISIKYILFFIIGLLFATPLMDKLVDKIKDTKYGNYIVDICYILIFILSVIFIIVGSYSPFIYFRF